MLHFSGTTEICVDAYVCVSVHTHVYVCMAIHACLNVFVYKRQLKNKRTSQTFRGRLI